MKTRIVAGMLAVGAVAGSLNACSGKNPPPPCNVGHGDYAAKYTYVEGSKTGTGTCDTLHGEAIVIDKYYPTDGGDSLVAMQPEAAMALGLTPVEGSNLFNIGNLESEQPTPESFCNLVNMKGADTLLTPAPVELLEDGGVPDGSGIDLSQGTVSEGEDGGYVFQPNDVPVKYEFSNVKFWVIGAAPAAQQFTADLKYTEGSCSAKYKVVGMYPAVHCMGQDADGNPVADDSLCSPFEDYDAGRLFGSGIFYQFDTFCDANTGYCQLKADTIGKTTILPKYQSEYP